jgi:hypothetical protein
MSNAKKRFSTIEKTGDLLGISLCNPPVFLVSCSRPKWRLPAVLDDVSA